VVFPVSPIHLRLRPGSGPGPNTNPVECLLAWNDQRETVEIVDPVAGTASDVAWKYMS